MMQRQVSVTLVVLAMGGLVSLYSGCANPQSTNSNTNTVALATPEPTPDKAAIEAELTRIENDWPRIMKERDGAAVRRVDADDAHLLGWDGSVASKEEDAKFIESGALAADSLEMTDISVKILDRDAAVVTGGINIKGGKLKAQDRTVEVSGQYRFVDTFARRNGQWLLVGSATVKVMAPTAEASPAKPSPTMKPSPAAKASPTAKASPVRKPTPKAVVSP